MNFERLLNCYPDEVILPRMKRAVPLLAAAVPFLLKGLGVTAVFGVGGGGMGLYSWLSSSSSSNRLDEKDKLDEIRDRNITDILGAIADLKNLVNSHAEEIRTGKSKIETLTEMVKIHTDKIDQNKQAILHMATMQPSIMWDSMALHSSVEKDAKAIHDIVSSCKRRKMNLAALNRLGGESEMQDFDDNDTHLESIKKLSNDTVEFRFSVRIEEPDTKILKVVAFNHFVDETTSKPKFVIYGGPTYAIFNSSNGCLRGIDQPEFERVYINCVEEGFVDPSFKRWDTFNGTLEERNILARPKMYKTESWSIAYCLYHKIDIGSKSRYCPAHVFKIPISVSFGLPYYNYHNSTFYVKELKESVVELDNIVLMNKTDDDLDREYFLIDKLRNSADTTIEPGKLGVDKETFTMPVTWLWISIVFLTTIFLSLASIIVALRMRRPAPTTEMPITELNRAPNVTTNIFGSGYPDLGALASRPQSPAYMEIEPTRSTNPYWARGSGLRVF